MRNPYEPSSARLLSLVTLSPVICSLGASQEKPVTQLRRGSRRKRARKNGASEHYVSKIIIPVCELARVFLPHADSECSSSLSLQFLYFRRPQGCPAPGTSTWYSTRKRPQGCKDYGMPGTGYLVPGTGYPYPVKRMG